MNRSGVAPQSLRGLPNSFSSQPQQLSQNRAMSNRLPNGKMAGNSATWGFGNSQMGNAGVHAQRPNNGPMTSFAQTIGGSQPGAPLDLSEFPSLSNNPPQQSSNSTQSTWALPTSRNIGQNGPQRPAQSILQAQQSQVTQQNLHQQDDMFRTPQGPNNQSNFRFNGQSAAGQVSQPMNATDDFPPLSGNISEMNQDRSIGLLQNSNFGSQPSSTLGFGSGLGESQGTRGNGLLNALSDSIRAPSGNARGVSPAGLGASNTLRSPVEPPNSSSGPPIESESNGLNRPPQPRGQNSANALEQTNSGHITNRQTSTASEQGPPSQVATSQQQLHSSGPYDSSNNAAEDLSPELEDPLPGISDKDRFGLKGLLAVLKGPYPDQAALITGVDVSTLGLDLGSNERLSESVWSPWDDVPAKPEIPHFTLPECYQVYNVQSIDNKMSNFSDETLMFMFYSNPQDIQQVAAAQELTNRNWRYHKKLQLWLTKDDMMVPQQLGANTERGYYVFFDPKLWMRERREFLLNYVDLEVATAAPSGPVS